MTDGGPLRVVGAGLPRTATASLAAAFEQLLGGPTHHMSTIPGHPFDLGDGWDTAIAGGTPDWAEMMSGYVAADDWPSMFWRGLSDANPDALILLSVRDGAESWWESCQATFLPYARLALAPDWKSGRGLTDLLARFAGTPDWDDPPTLMAAYDRHNAEVRASAPPERLLVWHASEGWPPICKALGLPLPDSPFPWTNRRENWG